MTASKNWPPEHLQVCLGGSPCGALWQQSGKLTFVYATEWLDNPRRHPISQSLPLREAAHSGPEVAAFFGNLLPEGDVRTAISRALQISLKNDYRLLEAIGGDCAGALSLEPPGAAPMRPLIGTGEVLSREALGELLKRLPQRPLLAGEDGLRISLAGAQLKLVLCKAGEDWIKPPPGGVTTHIVKPPIQGLEGSVENELFCMMLARRCGLSVPDHWCENDPHFYAIERYDRRRNPTTSRMERLHQEDFCQALGVAAAQKYQSEGGPSLKDCFDLISRVSADAVTDRLRLLRWVLFNFFIGNNDAHAKNLSLLYLDGKVRLAPFYDLISTAVYGNLDEKFAMKIGGAKSARYMALHHLDGFADECGLAKAFVRSEMMAMCGDILNALTPVREEMLNRYTRLTLASALLSSEEETVHVESGGRFFDLCIQRCEMFSAWLRAEQPQTKLPLRGIADGLDPKHSK